MCQKTTTEKVYRSVKYLPSEKEGRSNALERSHLRIHSTTKRQTVICQHACDGRTTFALTGNTFAPIFNTLAQRFFARLAFCATKLQHDCAVT